MSHPGPVAACLGDAHAHQGQILHFPREVQIVIGGETTRLSPARSSRQVALRQPHLRLHRGATRDQVAGEAAPRGDLSVLVQRRQRLYVLSPCLPQTRQGQVAQRNRLGVDDQRSHHQIQALLQVALGRTEVVPLP